MESFLWSDRGQVRKPYNSSEEARQKWRNLYDIISGRRRRRSRFTAKLFKNYEDKLRIFVLVLRAALHFIHGHGITYKIPEDVEAAGFKICAEELGSIVEGHNLEKLKLHDGVDGIANKLLTSVTDGISTAIFLLKRRRRIYGVQFSETPVKGFWAYVWKALQDMTLMILAFCAFVSLVVSIMIEGWQKGAQDGVGIVASIFLVVYVTATSDYRQLLQFKLLYKEKKNITVQVTRNGFRQKISIYELLPGDIVHLAMGDQVPADGLFLSGVSLLIDESSLKGESEPISVSTKNPFLLSGTKVLNGSCKMLITNVGMRTRWGKLMANLSEVGDDETPIRFKRNGVASVVGKIGLVFAIITFIVITLAVLVQGLFSQKHQEGSHGSWSANNALEMVEYFAITVTIVVAVVSEGLPLAVSMTLAFAMKKMMNDKALVCHRAACESMGAATNICIDKTGTLTTNHMTVVKLCICGQINEGGGSIKASAFSDSVPNFALQMLLESIFSNTENDVVNSVDKDSEILRTPTESALLEFGLLLGGDFQAARQTLKLVKFEPYNSEKERMGVVLELPGRHFRAHCIGVSEIMLAACDKVIDSKGEIVPLDRKAFNHLSMIIDNFVYEALLTLCLVYKDLGSRVPTESPIPFSGYTCIGIVGIKDAVCPGVKDPVTICRSVRITDPIVTGENVNTRKAFARDCGILTHGIEIEQEEFRLKNKAELHEHIPEIQVGTRPSPLDNHIQYLRTTFEEVVAGTSDGTNNSLPLHEADTGLAVEISEIEVAEESTDVTYLDSIFSTISPVVQWGSSVYIKLPKFVQLQLTVNVVALAVNFSTACLKGEAPLTVVQLLWINMIMDTFGALTLVTELPDDELMKQAPDGRKWRHIFGQSLFQFIVIWYPQTRGKLVCHHDGPYPDFILFTLMFNSFVFCQAFNEMSSPEMEKINVFEGILRNYVFVTVLSCTVHFRIIIVEFLGTFANTCPLGLQQWFASIAFGFLSMPIAAAVKLFPIGTK